MLLRERDIMRLLNESNKNYVMHLNKPRMVGIVPYYVLASVIIPAVLVSVCMVNSYADQQDVIEVNITEPCRLYNDNPLAPDYEYTGKDLKIWGVISSIGSDGLLGFYENNNNTELFSSYILDCKGLPINQLPKLRPGDTILVKGRYSSLDTPGGCSIHLSNCELLCDELKALNNRKPSYAPDVNSTKDKETKSNGFKNNKDTTNHILDIDIQGMISNPTPEIQIPIPCNEGSEKNRSGNGVSVD